MKKLLMVALTVLSLGAFAQDPTLTLSGDATNAGRSGLVDFRFLMDVEIENKWQVVLSSQVMASSNGGSNLALATGDDFTPAAPQLFDTLLNMGGANGVLDLSGGDFCTKTANQSQYDASITCIDEDNGGNVGEVEMQIPMEIAYEVFGPIELDINVKKAESLNFIGSEFTYLSMGNTVLKDDANSIDVSAYTELIPAGGASGDLQNLANVDEGINAGLAKDVTIALRFPIKGAAAVSRGNEIHVGVDVTAI